MKLPRINLRDDTAEILLYDPVGGWDGINAKAFVQEIGKLKGKSISLRINSPGGDVFDGMAIYNALTRHKGNVTVDIDGAAASIASVIAMAGTPIRMAKNAFMMIHRPFAFTLGDEAEHRKRADLLKDVYDKILDTYDVRDGVDRAKIAAWVDAETWLTAEEAIDAGLADEITEPARMAAHIDSHWLRGDVPAKVKDRIEDTQAKQWEETKLREERLRLLTQATST